MFSDSQAAFAVHFLTSRLTLAPAAKNTIPLFLACCDGMWWLNAKPRNFKLPRNSGIGLTVWSYVGFLDLERLLLVMKKIFSRSVCSNGMVWEGNFIWPSDYHNKVSKKLDITIYIFETFAIFIKSFSFLLFDSGHSAFALTFDGLSQEKILNLARGDVKLTAIAASKITYSDLIVSKRTDWPTEIVMETKINLNLLILVVEYA